MISLDKSYLSLFGLELFDESFSLKLSFTFTLQSFLRMKIEIKYANLILKTLFCFGRKHQREII